MRWKREASQELLDEKKAIEEMLRTLGYDAENKAPARKRRRTAVQGDGSSVQKQEGPTTAVSES